MHFFNPVHMMPLVEVIRGSKTSEEAVATVVAYAKKMGKTPIVVNDCPGFLVNRVLFPYFAGFAGLVRDGGDFTKIDKVMEKFGFPMGPAYLLDVVGIDTGVHANEVMAEGFPDRMKADFKSAMEVMFENERYGQKNGKGFYVYETDKRGKPKKVVDETTYELIKPVVADAKEFDAEEIIARCMIPMCIEVARCIEEGIVDTAAEADMGLIFGIGFLHSVVVHAVTWIPLAWLTSLHCATSTLTSAICTKQPIACVKWQRTAKATSVNQRTRRI